MAISALMGSKILKHDLRRMEQKWNMILMEVIWAMGKRKCCHSEYFLFICMHAKLLNDFTGKICHVFQCKKDMQRWKLASTNVTGKGTFCSLSGFVTSFFSKWKIVFYCCIFLLSPFLSFIIIFFNICSARRSSDVYWHYTQNVCWSTVTLAKAL